MTNRPKRPLVNRVLVPAEGARVLYLRKDVTRGQPLTTCGCGDVTETAREPVPNYDKIATRNAGFVSTGFHGLGIREVNLSKGRTQIDRHGLPALPASLATAAVRFAPDEKEAA